MSLYSNSNGYSMIDAVNMLLLMNIYF